MRNLIASLKYSAKNFSIVTRKFNKGEREFFLISVIHILLPGALVFQVRQQSNAKNSQLQLYFLINPFNFKIFRRKYKKKELHFDVYKSVLIRLLNAATVR